jgi:hypothetical protein
MGQGQQEGIKHVPNDTISCYPRMMIDSNNSNSNNNSNNNSNDVEEVKCAF